MALLVTEEYQLMLLERYKKQQTFVLAFGLLWSLLMVWNVCAVRAQAGPFSKPLHQQSFFLIKTCMLFFFSILSLSKILKLLFMAQILVHLPAVWSHSPLHHPTPLLHLNQECATPSSPFRGIFARTLQSLAYPQDKADSAWKCCLLCQSGFYKSSMSPYGLLWGTIRKLHRLFFEEWLLCICLPCTSLHSPVQ